MMNFVLYLYPVFKLLLIAGMAINDSYNNIMSLLLKVFLVQVGHV
jgi:hypothetical protein